MEVTATKRVSVNGTSLSLNITQEARMLGLKAGDIVEVVLKSVSRDPDTTIHVSELDCKTGQH